MIQYFPNSEKKCYQFGLYDDYGAHSKLYENSTCKKYYKPILLVNRSVTILNKLLPKMCSSLYLITTNRDYRGNSKPFTIGKIYQQIYLCQHIIYEKHHSIMSLDVEKNRCNKSIIHVW